MDGMATELITVSTQVQAMTRARLDRLSLRTHLPGPELLRIALLEYLAREERRLGIRGQYDVDPGETGQ